MSRSAAPLMVHPSRLVQLKKIAEAHGETIHGAIEHFIFDQIRAGVIEDETPGFTMRREGDGVAVIVGDLEPVVLNWPEVEKISEKLFWIASSTTSENAEPITGFALDLASGGRWLIGRVGKGYFITLTDANKRTAKFTMTPALLRDLDRQMTSTRNGIKFADMVRHLERTKPERTQA